MIVAIAGASGLTGSLCLSLLLQHPQVTQVVAIGRKKLPVEDPKLQQVLLQNGQLNTPVVADAFISCIGTTIKKAGSKQAFEATDRHLPVHIAQMLYQQGHCKKAAIVSSMGTAENSLVFYSRVKALMEADFKKIGFEALHILRPSIIDGTRNESRPMERFWLMLTRACHPLMVGTLRHFRAIKATTIAAVLVQCILAETTGTFIYLSGTIQQMAKAPALQPKG
jgi:uncharacterized protein YbjT (DUF2867 family)